jgi:hypothetical protein
MYSFNSEADAIDFLIEWEIDKEDILICNFPTQGNSGILIKSRSILLEYPNNEQHLESLNYDIANRRLTRIKQKLKGN